WRRRTPRFAVPPLRRPPAFAFPEVPAMQSHTHAQDMGSDLAIADDALARRDLAHAVHHLGAGLCKDPLSREIRARLDLLAALQPDQVLALVPDPPDTAKGATHR